MDDFLSNFVLNDEEKERYYQQLQERLGNKEKELMDPVLEEINATIKKIADKKGLKVGIVYPQLSTLNTNPQPHVQTPLHNTIRPSLLRMLLVRGEGAYASS